MTLMRKYDLEPEEVLVIGDTVTDLRYAQKAGVDACAVEYGYGELQDLKALLPRYMVKSLIEL